MAKGMNLKAILSLDAKQFQQGIGKIQQQIGSITNAFKGAFAVGSVAMFGKTLVEFTKNYEDAMARVKAVSNASASEMNMMNNEAMRLGATTRYTATQVAETLEVLTRNGFSAEKATKSLAATLQLAQSQAINLADAGNMITNSLNMFGLSVNEVQRVNDVMASIASNTATNVQDFYDALVNAAPMAHALGISIEETAAALGSLAQRGIKGADAGTQLRMSLQKMVDPSSMKKLKALGIEIDEDIIKAEGLKGVLEKLNKANLSVSQLNEIFTVRSSKSILQLVNAVDDFNAILNITENSSGTAMRMFEEGVGSVRKELDILRSVWENLLITWGNATKGPINAVIKGLQNTITAFKSFGGAAVNVATILNVVYSQSIAKFIMTFAGIKKTLGDASTSFRMFISNVSGGREKLAVLEEANARLSAQIKSSNKSLSADYKARARAAIQANNAEIASLKTLGTAYRMLLGVVVALASVALQQFVTWLINMNAQVREAEKNLKNVSTTIQNTTTQVNVLKEMIGNGENKASLNSAVRISIELFPQFADAIRNAQIEAGKVNNYQKLKDLLQDISELQESVIKRDALKGVIDANVAKLGRNLRNQAGIYNITLALDAQLGDLYKGNKDKQQEVFNQLASIIITSSNDTKKQIALVKNFLDGWGVERTLDQVEEFLKKVKLGTPADTYNTNPNTRNYKDNGYQRGVEAMEDYMTENANAERKESNIRFDDAWKEYIRLGNEAAKNFGEGTREYKQRMSELVDALEEKTKDLTLSANDRYNVEYQRKLYPKQVRTTTTPADGGSSSKKKNEWDKFTDTLDDYNKQMTALKSQLDNNAISQKEYDAAILKLRKDTWMAIAAMDELDKKMKKLSQPQKDVIKDVQETFPKEGDVGNALVEAAEALKNYADKQDEINTTRENGGYQNIDEYLADLKKLDDETWKNISSLKGLDQALTMMPDSLKKLYEKLLRNVASNKNQTKEEQKIEIESYQVPPKFQYKTEEEYKTKSEDYSELVNVMRDYLKRVSQLKTENEKGNLSTEDLQNELDKLDEMTQASLLGFRNLNEIVGVLPNSYKDAAKKLMESGPKSMDELLDKRAFIAVMADYSTKAAELMRKKADGIIDDNTYNTEMDKLVDETGKSLLSFKSLDAIIELLPPAIRDVYRELRNLYNKLHEVNESDTGDNQTKPQQKLPTPKAEQEAAPVVEVKPIVSVEVSVDEKELGEKIGENAKVNVKVDVKNEDGQSNPEVEALLKQIERAIKGDKQFKIDSDIEDQELKLKVKLEDIDKAQKEMEQLESDIKSGNYSGTLEMAKQKLEKLKEALIKARDEATNMNDKLMLSKGIEKLNTEIENLKTTAVDNISNIASAFDRVIDGIEAIYEAFGEEINMDGLKKAMSVINGIIQIMEALHTVIKMVQVADDIATKKKVANSATEVAANMAVASSEMTEAGAAASAAAAKGGESVASVPYVGPILAIAAIASIVAAMIAAFSSLKRFESGGILGGTSSSGDKNIYRGNKGEMVINKAQQGALYRAIAEGRLGGGNVEFTISGDSLVGVLKNHNRKWN